LAVAAGCSAGVVYAVLSTSIRRTVTRDTRLSFLVFVITAMGVLTLGPLSFFRLGPENLLATPGEQWALMLAAGTANLVGFVAITKGLQFTTVVHANVLNASQVALAAVAGMLLFLEPPNPWLLVGVGLTVLGIVLIDRPVETI
jgi:drug/metabolite transporter (DMT)-like permease